MVAEEKVKSGQIPDKLSRYSKQDSVKDWMCSERNQG